MSDPRSIDQTNWRALVGAWPVWLKVTTPVLVAVIVAVVTAVFAFDNIRPAPERVESDQRHAERICERYARAHAIDDDSVGSGALRARDLKQLGRQLHVEVSPWDRYPNNHFIASCTFWSAPDLTQVTELNTTTPTSRCPNGDIVVIVKTEPPRNVYVDDQGHSSADPFADLPSPFEDVDPCSEPK